MGKKRTFLYNGTLSVECGLSGGTQIRVDHNCRATEKGAICLFVNHHKLYMVDVLLYIHRNRRFIMDGRPGRPPRLSHNS